MTGRKRNDKPNLTDAPQEVVSTYEQLDREARNLSRRDRKRRPIDIDHIHDIAAEQSQTVLEYLKLNHTDLSSEDIAVMSLWLDYGYTEAQIGQMLGCSVRTVKRRVAAIKQKIGPL